MRMAMVETTRIRLRSSARSSMGTATRRSTATKANPAATARARQPRVATDVHPQSPPLLSASTNGMRVSATSRLPATSIERDRFGSRDSATVAAVRAMHAPATPASTQNSACQLASSTRTPPSSGPAAAPTAAAAPQYETARSWSAPRVATESRLSPQARIVAPEAPCIARPRMTMPPESESAISTQDAMKSSRPYWKMRRRPKTSPSEPEVTMVAAPTSE
nr:hypothetical protein GCM10020092_040960 [Actinoplanes digitatis]